MNATSLFGKPSVALLLCVALAACGVPQEEAPAAGETMAPEPRSAAPRVAARAPAASGQSWTRQSDNGLFKITLSPQQGQARIGPLHNWIVEVSDRHGAAVSAATIGIGGGMPGHGHGLPTQPQVTRHLGGGRHLIEGMQFNMAGDWVLTVAVETDAGRVRDQARFEFPLAF